jgi:aminomuconate-semialdehyde/2-hydroxymuconate-6-semialdehyde dehydrogenase
MTEAELSEGTGAALELIRRLVDLGIVARATGHAPSCPGTSTCLGGTPRGPPRRGRGAAPDPLGAAGGPRGPDGLAARDPALANAVEWSLGDPLDEATEVGPLASREHWEKVTGYLDLAAAEGAKLRTGGRGHGWWVKPTVLVDVREDMRICQEEIFGPVVVVQPFDTDEEAVALANDSPYGLNATVFTESLGRAHRVAAAVRAGTIWVNCFFVRDPRAPFGGYRDSGVGREGGRYSRDFFTEAKAVVTQL